MRAASVDAVVVALALAVTLALATVASAQDPARGRPPSSRELERRALTLCHDAPSTTCASLLAARADAAEWRLAGILTATVGGVALVAAALGTGFASQRREAACVGSLWWSGTCTPTTVVVGNDDGLLALSITFAGLALAAVVVGVAVSVSAVSRAHAVDYGAVASTAGLRVTPSGLVLSWL